LENRQKLWRWLIIAVMAILLIETALAGRLAHRTLQPQVST
jgi:anti-sigma-K factor RskA